MRTSETPSMPPRVAAAVRQLRQRLGPGTHFFLFGSRSTGEARTSSDWDIAIKADHPLDWQEFAAMKGEAGEIAWPYKVDIVDLDRAPEPMRASIEETCRILEDE